MSAKEREFFSEHSSNYRNNQTIASIGEKHFDELKDEDYGLYMDENKKVKVKYFSSNKKNQNFPKLRSDKNDVEIETSETSKFDNDNSLIIQGYQGVKDKKKYSKALSLVDKKLSFSTHGHNYTQKKDITWMYPDNSDHAPSLEVLDL